MRTRMPPKDGQYGVLEIAHSVRLFSRDALAIVPRGGVPTDHRGGGAMRTLAAFEA